MGPVPAVLRNVLAQFDFPCEMYEVAWEEAWEELVRIGLYRSGPDVSQIGTTWLESIVATGAVRPFTDGEVDSIGGNRAFFPAAWQTVFLPWERDSKVWAIPWLVGTRIIFYWRDMLEQAGIDEQTAFSTPDSVEETMIRLQESAVETPWGVWAIGGHILAKRSQLGVACWRRLFDYGRKTAAFRPT
jgi:maltose-binding protein MalE